MKKILIIGAGQGGIRVLGEINRAYADLKIIGFIDDKKELQEKKVQGLEVMGNIDQIKDIVQDHKADEIIVAVPSLRGDRLAKLIEKIKKTQVPFKILPGIYEVIEATENEKLAIGKIRNLDLADLLNRDPIRINLDIVSSYLKNKRILITGAGGSIGSEIARQVVHFSPKALILLDIYENNLYELEQELDFKSKAIVCDIKDRKLLEDTFLRFRPEIIFHAAAHKHVSLMEYAPQEAIKNNIIGSHNLIELAKKYNVQRFVFISSDKAINPTSIMGASKRFTEYEIINTNSRTIFAIVRFGNVLGSYGSVIPLWKKQLEANKPLTVTHKDMRRFFMTIPEAVSLVIQACGMARKKEIYFLKMGKQYKIYDLACKFCKLFGLTVGHDVQIKLTQPRPGEKLSEVIKEEWEKHSITVHDKIIEIIPRRISQKRFTKVVSLFINNIDNLSREVIIKNLRLIIPSFKHYSLITMPKKNKKIINFSPPSIDVQEIKAVTRVLKSRWLTTGQESARFEDEFAKKFRFSKALAVSSATAGLHLALIASGVGRHDEVIIPSYTFTSCAHAVEWLGARPVFVDINSNFLLDPIQIERKITKRTRAIMVVHFAGQMADMREIIKIANSNNLKIIEDCAHALGSTYSNQLAGSMGDMGVFSFYPTKNITTGEGGMIVSRDSNLMQKIEILRNHGINSDAFARYSDQGKWYYEVVESGYKYNLADIAASIGRVQLGKFDTFQRKREEIAKYYLDNLSDVTGLKLPEILPGRTHVWHLFSILVDPNIRNKLIEGLRKFNIVASVHFIPLHLHPYYQNKYKYQEGDFPESEKAYYKEISLPIYPDLSRKDQEYIVRVLKYLLSNS